MKILVVDDNMDFCLNVRDILELRGYDTLFSHNGVDALRLAVREKPDLILLDVRMPIMDGVAVFRKLKGAGVKVPVILMSAYAVDDLVIEALRQGAFGSVRKPPDMEYLLSMISDALSRKGRVLLVNASGAATEGIQASLEQRGYRVITAANGNTAVRKVWEASFDLIILNLDLFAQKGLETYLAIRQVRPSASIVIIDRGTDIPMPTKMPEGVYIWANRPVDAAQLVSLIELARSEKEDK